MSGKEFVDRLLRSSRFRSAYDENMYFRNQIDHLRKVKDVHTQHLIECMICLSNELIQKDLDMIAHSDNGYLREEDFL